MRWNADLFVIRTLGVHVPHVVLLSKKVAYCKHCRQHRVILIIVLVEAIASNGLQVAEAA